VVHAGLVLNLRGALGFLVRGAGSERVEQVGTSGIGGSGNLVATDGFFISDLWTAERLIWSFERGEVITVDGLFTTSGPPRPDLPFPKEDETSDTLLLSD
jgi:hypothetical protein